MAPPAGDRMDEEEGGLDDDDTDSGNEVLRLRNKPIGLDGAGSQHCVWEASKVPATSSAGHTSAPPSPIGASGRPREALPSALPPTPRPPSPSALTRQQRMGRHYRAWHWRALGLQGGMPLESVRSMNFPEVGEDGQEIREPEDEDAIDAPKRGKATAAATAELIAAVAKQRRLLECSQEEAPRPPPGSPAPAGRAGREAAWNARERARRREEAYAEAKGREEPTRRQLHSAIQGLRSAQAAEGEELLEMRLAKERRRQEELIITIQAIARSCLARRRFKDLREGKTRPEQEAQQRLLAEFRAPRPVRLVCGFEEELRTADEAAAEQAAMEARFKAQREAEFEEAQNANGVIVTFAIDGVDGERLRKRGEQVLDAFKSAMERAVAAEAGQDILQEDVMLSQMWTSLSAVEVSIVPPEGMPVFDVLESLRSSRTVSVSVVEELSLVEGLDSLLVGYLSADLLSIRATRAPLRPPRVRRDRGRAASPGASLRKQATVVEEVMTLLGNAVDPVSRRTTLAWDEESLLNFEEEGLPSPEGSVPPLPAGQKSDGQMSQTSSVRSQEHSPQRSVLSSFRGMRPLSGGPHRSRLAGGVSFLSPPSSPAPADTSAGEEESSGASGGARTPSPAPSTISHASGRVVATGAVTLGAVALEWRMREEIAMGLRPPPTAAPSSRRSSRVGSPPPPKQELPSIHLPFEEQAAISLRNLFAEMQRKPGKPGTVREVVEASAYIKEQYIESCKVWHVKPNSQALSRFSSTETAIGTDGLLETSYDFSMAYLGDRGAICALHALAHDPHCGKVSLMSCGLRRASAQCIAVFLELHPRLAHMDLSQNNLSYDSGEYLLEGLRKRAEHSKSKKEDERRPRPVAVNLGGTALAWDRTGYTVGPPAGSLWAAHGDRSARFNPVSYERLRCQLDSTRGVLYERSERSRTPSPQSQRSLKAGRRQINRGLSRAMSRLHVS